MALVTILSLISGAGGVTAAEIATNAIGSDELADDAVDSGAIAANAVGSSEIATGAVGSDEATGLVAGDLDLTGAYNFSDLSVSGVAVTPGSTIYYLTVDRVQASNITNLTNACPQSVDGSNVTNGMDVLYIGASDNTKNGIYDVTSAGSGSNGAWARAANADSVGELPIGQLVFVKDGAAGGSYKGQMYKLTSVVSTLGSDAVIYEKVTTIQPTNSGEAETLSGTVNGSNDTFTFAAVGRVVACDVRVNNIPQLGSTWHISHGTGGGGEDQVIFESGNIPTSGTVSVYAFIQV